MVTSDWKIVMSEKKDEIPHEYLSVIEDVKLKSSSLVQAQMSESEVCFGWQWKDDSGICPLDGTDGNELCGVRDQCRRVYEAVQKNRDQKRSASKKPVKAKKKKVRSQSLTIIRTDRDLDTKERVRISVSKRLKWAGTGKYARRSYKNENRPVDRLVRAFRAPLEDAGVKSVVQGFQHLPRTDCVARAFIREFGGELVISFTASYLVLVYRGRIIMRFWTNSTRSSLVDFVPDLLPAVNKIVSKHSQDWEGISEVTDTPDHNWSKLRPCTHRVSCYTPDIATELATLLIKRYVK